MIEDVISDPVTINVGSPQGAILSPTIFIILISDIGLPLLVPSTHSNSTQNMALQVPALWTQHLVYHGTPGTALEVSIFVRAEGHFPCSPEVFRRPFSLPTSPFGTQYFSPVICRRKLDPCLQHGLVCHSYRKHFRRQFSVSICLLTRQ